MRRAPRPFRQSTLAAVALVVLVTLSLAACGPAATPAPTPGPTPTPGPALTIPQLKIALGERFGALWYCDPDFYPIAREDEQKLAIERFAEVRGDTEAYVAILAHLGLSEPAAGFGDAEKLIIYRAWKVLRAIVLDPVGSDRYRFDYLAQPAPGAPEGSRTGGFISATGEIEIERQAAVGEPICPICLARGTRIETPDGPVAVDLLRIGDPVWTLDDAGRRGRGVVMAVGSTPVPIDHEVIRLVLADGRAVTASPGHPLADGRSLGDLRPGDAVGGSAVASAERIRYTGGETYDILVSGGTGVYLVDGIALGSTLRH